MVNGTSDILRFKKKDWNLVRYRTRKNKSIICIVIRLAYRSLWGKSKSQNISILYGGSVSPSNASDILNLDQVDGALVGGASLKSKDFSKIIDSYS